MSGGQFMVVLIVLIVVIGKVIANSMGYGGKRGRRRDRDGRGQEGERAWAADAEADRLRAEMQQLKERLSVLERIATDGSSELDRQIEALRDHRDGPRTPLPRRDPTIERPMVERPVRDRPMTGQEERE